MTLATDAILHAVARTLREQVTPAVTDRFVADLLRMAANQVEYAARAWDDAAVLRVEENRSLRALFADAAPIVPDAALRDALREAAASADPGLSIGVLDRENNRLRHLLVRLHEAVEAVDAAPARAMDRRIWALLRAIEQSRAPRS